MSQRTSAFSIRKKVEGEVDKVGGGPAAAAAAAPTEVRQGGGCGRVNPPPAGGVWGNLLIFWCQ